MSKESVLRSDLSGRLIEPGEEVVIRIDNGTHTHVLDLSQAEVAELFGGRGRVIKKRGRPATPAAVNPA